MLSDEEKFRFDLEGYLSFLGCLVPKNAQCCHSKVTMSGPGKLKTPPFGAQLRSVDGVLSFRNLMDHPRVLPYLIELIGPRVPRSRLRHLYAPRRRVPTHSRWAHALRVRSLVPLQRRHHAQWLDGGNMGSTDAGPNDGGFVCVPGSHKTNFIDRLPKTVHQQVMPEYVRQPIVKAGDVILFTEALMHGTRAWQGDHERRVLLFKYSPPHSSWAKQGYDLADYPDATEQQRRLMDAPSVEDHAKVAATNPNALFTSRVHCCTHFEPGYAT